MRLKQPVLGGRTVALLAALIVGLPAFCADTGAKVNYLERAEEVFRIVWDKYYIPERGLFSEYYPSSHKPDLTYFQEGAMQAKEVSYLWPMSGVFSSAAILAQINPEKYRKYLDLSAAAAEKYLDGTRSPRGYQAYPAGLEKADRYYDDNGVAGIDFADSYEATKNAEYLEKSKEAMRFVESGWSDDFGGGLPWLEGVRDQKPACSNGKAAILALKLYRITGEEKYLRYGMKTYNWIMSTLRDGELGIIWNSLLTKGGTQCEVQKHAYAYNTGMAIQAAVRLYGITGNAKYLEDAKSLAEGSHKFYFGRTDDGVPFANDMPWFVLVLFRGYHELYDADKDPKYVDTVIGLADWAWLHSRDKEGLFYKDWSGRADESKTPKWLLNAACMAELYARISLIKGDRAN